VQLLNRSHRGTIPTAAGETLVRRARAILADHDQAVSEVMALGNNGSIVAGRIRVGVPLELPLDTEHAPPWYDEVSAIPRTHGLGDRGSGSAGDPPVTAEVKFAAVRAGRSFSLAPPGWSANLPEGVHWHPMRNPIVRRTWAVWPADSRQRDLAALVAALRLPADPMDSART
jgi:DNA-binding transcriptional LysR family regulator